MSDRDARYSLEDPADSGYQDAHDDVEIEDVEDVEDYPPEGGRRKRRGRSIPGCLAALVALALIAAGAYVAVTKGAEFIRDQFSTAADYPGPGRGKVTFEVQEGDTVGDRRKQFPQIIHIQLGRRIVQHQARRRCSLHCLEGELTQDESSRQELLLTSRYAVPGGRSLEEERHIRPVRTDRGRA